VRGEGQHLPNLAGPLLAIVVLAVALWPSSTPLVEGYPGNRYIDTLSSAPAAGLYGATGLQTATITSTTTPTSETKLGVGPVGSAPEVPTSTPTATPTVTAAAGSKLLSSTDGTATAAVQTTSAQTSTAPIVQTSTATPIAQTSTATPFAQTSTATPFVTATYFAGQTATAVVAPTMTAMALAAQTAAAQTSTAAPIVTATFSTGQTATAITAPTATYEAQATGTTVAAANATATYEVGATQTAEAWTNWTPEPTYTPTATVTAPSNDDFGSAIQFDSFPYSNTQDTRGATLANDDPSMGNDAGQNSATVWYRFTASVSGGVQVNTFNSDYDTVLAAFTGSRGSLSQLATNDDSVDRQSQISFNIQQGTTYYLEIGSYGSGGGGGQLHLAVELVSGSITYTPGTTTPGTITPTVAPEVLYATPGAQGGVDQTAQPALSTGDPRYFQSTGFRISRDSFWDYFLKRGGIRTFGYPISREFTLSGFQVQLFQRGMLQQKPDGSVTTVNLLDDGIMPYTRINGSTFPAAELSMKKRSPSPADSSYAEKALAFLESDVPDEWNGMQVAFHQTLAATVGFDDAFPQGEGEPALLPLMDLEMWGLPTSPPALDPSNHNFVYQRFQRGIMHFDKSRGTTEGLLLGDYLKSIMTGQRIPSDLDGQARGSPFYRQYDRTKPGFLARPGDLKGTNLVGAFEMDLPQ
jgi:hypothetical protein